MTQMVCRATRCVLQRGLVLCGTYFDLTIQSTFVYKLVTYWGIADVNCTTPKDEIDHTYICIDIALETTTDCEGHVPIYFKCELQLIRDDVLS